MKKILSFILFAAALIWTWHLVHNSDGISSETHSGIQAQMAETIKKTLAAKKPHATQLKIRQLYTENMGDNKVKAVFSYSYLDTSETGEAHEQTIEGEAILHRAPTEDNSVDQWVFQSVKTTNDAVAFSEGTVITPNMVSDNSAPAASGATGETGSTGTTAPTGTPVPESNGDHGAAH